MTISTSLQIQSTAVSTAQVGASQAPGSNPLTIGTVKFNSSETPTRLPIGVEQMVSVQTLIGGSRVVQTFGVSPKNVSWTGNLYGAYVQARVQQMRLYAASGNPVQLSWIKATYAATGNALQNNQASAPSSQIKEQYSVIIKDFTPEFFAQYAEYSIELVIVKALNGAYNAATQQSIDAQINTLQASATSYAASMLNSAAGTESEIAAASVAQSINVVNSTINAAVPISQNPLAGPSIQSAIQTAQTAVATYQGLQATGSSTLLTAIQLSSALTAISRNVAAGYSPQSVTQQGGNSFSIASQYYGDVSQAFTLSKLASLPSPFLPSGSFTNILLPNIQTSPQANKSSVI